MRPLTCKAALHLRVAHDQPEDAELVKPGCTSSGKGSKVVSLLSSGFRRSRCCFEGFHLTPLEAVAQDLAGREQQSFSTSLCTFTRVTCRAPRPCRTPSGPRSWCLEAGTLVLRVRVLSSLPSWPVGPIHTVHMRDLVALKALGAQDWPSPPNFLVA